jgi:hypothetical protein
VTIHKQTFAKVNVPVDGGMAGLINALALFPQLETVESCEGNTGRDSWVCFRYGEYWNERWKPIADFTFEFLAPNLAKMVGDSAEVRLRAATDGEEVFGELSVRPGTIEEVEAALRELAQLPEIHPRP